MTAQGEDILAWLETAISRVESVARAATDRQPYDEWDAVGDDREGDTARKHWSVVGIARMEPTPAARDLAAHIALHDPASVLRRCAADRKLIAAHPITRDVITVQPDGIHGFGCSVCHTEDLLTVGDGWCDSLRALAEGYGWTEGEQ